MGGIPDYRTVNTAKLALNKPVKVLSDSEALLKACH
jgi:hypothetical protein